MRRRPNPAQPDRHDHVVFHLSSGATVIFNDPRRFGVMDLLPPGGLSAHPALGTLGPEPLSEDFDGHALARACAGKKTTLKVALLDQRVVSGLGNIYVSEALHLAGLSPQRRASTIATPSGRRARPRIAWPPRSNRCWKKPSRGHRAEPTGRRGSASTTARARDADAVAVLESSGGGRRRGDRRSTAGCVSAEAR